MEKEKNERSPVSEFSSPSLTDSPTELQTRKNSKRSDRRSEGSFKSWHLRMQASHEQQGRPVFRIWKWCYKGCFICRWFDSISYEKNLFKCCFKFKTFKTIGTSCLLLLFVFSYVFGKILEGELPGPSLFLLMTLLSAAYLVGYIISLAGIPAMIGYLLTGFCFRNLPLHDLLDYDNTFVYEVSWNIEKFYLLIALVRAGLLLNLARIKNYVRFIFYIAIIPMLVEFLFVLCASRSVLRYELEWSAFQGSLICLVSLATITSVMEKNRLIGYGEDKNLSTVLIASAAISVIVGIFINTMVLSILVTSLSPTKPPTWMLIVLLCKQIIVGLLLGFLTGCLVAFFPDKHSENASFLRILLIGAGALGITTMCSALDMTGAGVLATVIFCLTASNMWEELGWHEYHNPVQYFYSRIYYLGQPIALTLIGFSVDFSQSELSQLLISFVVIFLGLSGRELACFLITLGEIYPTNMKENVFICIAWFSKGTFQALLVFAAEHVVDYFSKQENEKEVTVFRKRIKNLKETTLMAILIATPLANYGLSFLTPVLLTKAPENSSQPNDHVEAKV